jgi:hypothetical protein
MQTKNNYYFESCQAKTANDRQPFYMVVSIFFVALVTGLLVAVCIFNRRRKRI